MHFMRVFRPNTRRKEQKIPARESRDFLIAIKGLEGNGGEWIDVNAALLNACGC
jgi:hypothetical protein